LRNLCVSDIGAAGSSELRERGFDCHVAKKCGRLDNVCAGRPPSPTGRLHGSRFAADPDALENRSVVAGFTPTLKRDDNSVSLQNPESAKMIVNPPAHCELLIGKICDSVVTTLCLAIGFTDRK
jgi:hypothetical protein